MAGYLVTIVYSIVLLLLFVFAANSLYLSRLTIKYRGPDPNAPPLADYPLISVQIPLYNERYVAGRVIEAVSRLDWPQDRLEIQVLDDSTDDTLGIVASLVAHYRLRGFDIVHLHRTDRAGYKAGALAEGMKQAKGEFIAIFDADFLPPADFLLKTIPHFADPRVGFVQTRWGHLNAHYSLLTRLQSIAIDAHFTIEQFARQRAGFLMNFNGTAGVWRRQAIESAGGWRADTLTEDLDLSYRAQLAGWRGCYLRDLTTPAELPVTLSAFRRQQYRWARGSTECAIKLIPLLLREPLPLMVKFQGVMHLIGYWVQVLMGMVAFLYPLVLLSLRWQPGVTRLIHLSVLFTLAALTPTIYLIVGQREMKRPWVRQLPLILWLTVLGAGMMYHNAYAVFAGLFSREAAAFERTPKFGITGKNSQGWQQQSYHVRMKPGVLFELGMLVFNLNTVRMALDRQYLSIAFYAAIFALGMLFTLAITILQEAALIRMQWAPLRGLPPVEPRSEIGR